MKKQLLLILMIACFGISCKKEKIAEPTNEVKIEANGGMYNYYITEMLYQGPGHYKSGRVFNKIKHTGNYRESFIVESNTYLQVSFEDQSVGIEPVPIKVKITYKGKVVFEKTQLGIHSDVTLED